MDIDNWYAAVGFVFITVGVIIEALLIRRAVRELRRRPKDEYTGLTVLLLARPLIYVVTFSPFIPQLLLVSQRPPLTKLGAWISVSVPLGLMLLAFTTYLSYTYKERK